MIKEGSRFAPLFQFIVHYWIFNLSHFLPSTIH